MMQLWIFRAEDAQHLWKISMKMVFNTISVPPTMISINSNVLIAGDKWQYLLKGWLLAIIDTMTTAIVMMKRGDFLSFISLRESILEFDL